MAARVAAPLPPANFNTSKSDLNHLALHPDTTGASVRRLQQQEQELKDEIDNMIRDQDSLAYGDVDDLDDEQVQPRQPYSHRKVSSGSSSSDDAEPHFSRVQFELRLQQQQGTNRLKGPQPSFHRQVRSSSSTEDEADDLILQKNNNNPARRDNDDLTFDTLSHASTAAHSPQRLTSLPAPSTASTMKKSTTSFFDGMAQKLKAELHSNQAVAAGTPSRISTVVGAKSMMLEEAPVGQAKRVFGRAIGNEHTGLAAQPMSKPAATLRVQPQQVSSTMAAPPQLRQSSPAPLPLPTARPLYRNENVAPAASSIRTPAISFTSTPAARSSLPQPRPPRPTPVSPAALRVPNPTPASPVYNYSQRIRANNPVSSSEDEDEASGYDDARLPDRTGVTEGLQSPEKRRGHYSLPGMGKAVETQTSFDESVRIRSQLEADLKMVQAQLQAVEARAEGDRIRFEQELSTGRQGYSRQMQQVVDEYERRFGEERGKRQELETQIMQLSTQVAQLSADLKEAGVTLAHQQRQPAPAAVPTRQTRDDTTFEGRLLQEIRGIRLAIEQLSQDVGTLKTEVDSLSRGGVPVPRRDVGVSTASQRAESVTEEEQEEEDMDKTPRASSKRFMRSGGVGPASSRGGGSVHTPEELDHLKYSIAREELRHSPSPAAPRQSRRHHHHHHVAPVPRGPADHERAHAHFQPAASEQQDIDAKAQRVFAEYSSRPRFPTTAAAQAVRSAPAKMMNDQPYSGRRADREQELEELQGMCERKNAAFLSQTRLYDELSRLFRNMPAALGKKRRATADQLHKSIDILQNLSEDIQDLEAMIARKEIPYTYVRDHAFSSGPTPSHARRGEGVI